MRTYPLIDEKSNRLVGFEVENVLVSVRTVASLLAQVPGVSELRKRQPFAQWDEIHIWFRFRGANGLVWEPLGDISRFSIGQPESLNPVDMSDIERVCADYVPSDNSNTFVAELISRAGGTASVPFTAYAFRVLRP